MHKFSRYFTAQINLTDSRRMYFLFIFLSIAILDGSQELYFACIHLKNRIWKLACDHVVS